MQVDLNVCISLARECTWIVLDFIRKSVVSGTGPEEHPYRSRSYAPGSEYQGFVYVGRDGSPFEEIL